MTVAVKSVTEAAPGSWRAVIGGCDWVVGRTPAAAARGRWRPVGAPMFQVVRPFILGRLIAVN